MGGGYFPFFTENRPQKHKIHAFLHTSQANGGGSSPPAPPPWLRYWTQLIYQAPMMTLQEKDCQYLYHYHERQLTPDKVPNLSKIQWTRVHQEIVPEQMKDLPQLIRLFAPSHHSYVYAQNYAAIQVPAKQASSVV